MNYIKSCVDVNGEKDIAAQAQEYGAIHQAELTAKIASAKADLLRAKNAEKLAKKSLDKVSGYLTNNTDDWLIGMEQAESTASEATQKVKDLEYTIEIYEKYLSEYFSIQ